MKRTNQLHLFDCTSLDEDSDGHVCIKCDTFKDSSEFRFRENDGTSRRSICRQCTNRNGKIVQELRKYNPFPCTEDYKCPCCNKTEKELKEYGRWQDRSVWVLDHNHITEKFRGWICNSCNNALGRFEDNIDTLKRVIKYLEKNL